MFPHPQLPTDLPHLPVHPTLIPFSLLSLFQKPKQNKTRNISPPTAKRNVKIQTSKQRVKTKQN